jgi:5,6-dimethylbenzimidazole synthase
MVIADMAKQEPAGMAKRPPPRFDEAFRARLEELVAWRRDVRRFRRGEEVPEALLERLLELACHAPSVGLSQPWRFVFVDSAERRQAIRANFVRCNEAALAAYEDDRAGLYARLKLAGLDDAPVHLAVFVDRATGQGAGLGRRTMPEMLGYSVVMAIHTLWLAARAEGLGIGWVSILDPEEAAAALDAEPDWRLVAYLCVGWPEREDTTPELEREGWEKRRPGCTFIYRR